MAPRARSGKPARFALAAAVGLAGAAAHAGPADKQACVDAYDRAQQLRRDSRLIEARDALVTCAQPSCPAAAKADCVPWLAEVEAGLPSVVIEARDPAGHELVDVRVLVDGRPLSAAIDGKAALVDPGLHTFRFEPAAGAPLEERVTIREGEKNRRLTVVLGAAVLGAATATPPPPRGERSPAAAAPARPIPPLAWALAGLGVAGLGVFAVVGATSLADESELRATCAPRCAEDDVSAVRHKHTAADVGLGVGIAALGAAAWVFFARPAAPPPGAARTAGAGAFGVALTPGAGRVAAALTGAF